MKNFCKILEHPEAGQVLVQKIDRNDDDLPALRISFYLMSGIRVDVDPVWKDDSEESYEKLDNAFEKYSLEQFNPAYEQFKQLTEEDL